MQKLNISNNIYFNSENVQELDTFICNFAAEKYITQQLLEKAEYVLVNKNFYKRNQNIKQNNNIIELDNFQNEVYELVKKHFSLPKNIILITGTKGKTSSSWFVFQLLTSLNINCGYIGTLGSYYSLNKEIFQLDKSEKLLTTPSSDDIYKHLKLFKSKQIDYCILETSSHALEQERLIGIKAITAAITNIAEDHLDYHKTLEAYKNAKLKIFSNQYEAQNKIIYDEINFPNLNNEKIYSFGHKNSSDFSIKSVFLQDNLTNCTFNFQNKEYSFQTYVVSNPQIQNIVLAVSIVHLSTTIEISKILQHTINLKNAAGRLERVFYENTATNIIIDYAHNAYSTFSILLEFKKQNPNIKIATVFGCGGNRDKLKRPITTSIVAALSDYFIITTDNLRFETFQEITNDMLCGINSNALSQRFNEEEIAFIKLETEKYFQLMRQQNVQINKNLQYLIEENREKAIFNVINQQDQYDIILLLSKGNEEYIIVKDEKVPYSDLQSCHKTLKLKQ